jgi:methylmalonyl-CoA mutase C-terminal domain/subunit
MPQIRCVLGMMGIDPHNKGIRTLARRLRDEGVEVIYVGEHNTPDEMFRVAVDEDADLVGVSFSTSNYTDSIKMLLDARSRQGAESVELIVGGLIHPDHEQHLLDMGVAGVFGPGTSIADVVALFSRLFPDHDLRDGRTALK